RSLNSETCPRPRTGVGKEKIPVSILPLLTSAFRLLASRLQTIAAYFHNRPRCPTRSHPTRRHTARFRLSGFRLLAFLFFFLLSAFWLPTSALADCTTPAGTPGTFAYF